MTNAMPPRRILIGISCEADTTGVGVARADRHAFQQAAWLAQRTGAAVRALHVTDFLDDQLAHGRDKVAEIIRDSLKTQLDAMCSKAALSRVATSYGFAIGKPWYELLREAHRWEADLILITPRRTDIGITTRVIHGSTARRVIRKAQVPVWVAHPGPNVEVDNVLACVDGSPASVAVLEMANAVADLGHAKRTALRCLDYPDDIAVRRLPDAEHALRAYHAEIRGEAQRSLDAMVATVGGDWTVELHDGYVCDVVPSRVTEAKHDLVVLASTSRPLVAGLVFGTTAERILDSAPVSTLVVRPQGWKSPVSFDD